MSSPIQQKLTNEHPPETPLRNQAKQKLKEQREDRRQKQLELSREKVTDYECAQKDEEKLLRQASDVQVDLDQLIEEEERVLADREQSGRHDAGGPSQEQYLEELELLLAQEEAELELHFSVMAI